MTLPRGGVEPAWFNPFRRSLDRELTRLSRLADYTVATLPGASDHRYEMVFVTDESGGAVPAFSDGTNWRRVTDRAVVS